MSARRPSPRNPLPLRRQAEAAFARGDYGDAATRFAQAAVQAPADGALRHRLALALSRAGEKQAALEQYREAVALSGQDPRLFLDYGSALRDAGEWEGAELMLQMATVLAPGDAQAHCNLGHLHLCLGRLDLAGVHLRRAAALAPRLPQARNNLGALLERQGDLRGALAEYEAAAKASPAFVDAIGNRGCALLALGRPGEAARAFREALGHAPEDWALHSNLLFAMQFDETVDADALDRQHFEFGRRLEERNRHAWRPHGNDRDPHRPLRVGFVSADLRMHPVAAFLEPVLAAREAGTFHAVAYYTHPAVDETTRRLATRFEAWRHVHSLGDDALAEQVRSDRIDVLVDLSGHTAMNRLPVFARRPAPVQATWIGYPGSTGLASVGYRITDEALDPPGLTESRHAERLLRLPGFNVPFITPPEAPPVNALPALATGTPVLGCLNNPRKIGPRVVAAWARILQAAPTARLLVGGVTDAALGEDLASRFAAHGIEPARIEFAPRLASADYLALHHRIDLALDPFPYNGGTTSFHALWMGVPFVTLGGTRTASRSGASILARAGLESFVASDEDDYVRKALAVLADLPSLDGLRQSMRARIAADAGNEAQTVARRLEAALREAWIAWCAAGTRCGDDAD